MKEKLDVLTGLRASDAYSVSLNGISDGQHTFKVTATVTVKKLLDPHFLIPWGSPVTISEQAAFSIGSTNPNLSIISPQNKIFETIDVPLNFTLSEPVSEISYSLDERSNTTFTDDAVISRIYGKDNYYFVLNGLEERFHSLKIYAKDAAGYTGESETYYFTVNTQPAPTPSHSQSPILTPTMQPTLEPTQTATPTNNDNQTLDLMPIQVLSGVAAVAVAVGVLVYFKKRKSR